MANFVLDISRIPEGTGTANAYRFAGFGTTDEHIDITPTADSVVLGVVMDTVDASKVVEGAAVAVRVMGIAPVKLGTTATVSLGSKIATHADGTGIATTTAGTPYAGLALQTGTQGAIIDVLLTPGAKV